MSSNTIKVSITFSFNGETFFPSVVVDLDSLMNANSCEIKENAVLSSIYPQLAASIDINVYSYEYELMQAGDAVYSEPGGIAANHLIETKFDYHSFREEWLENKKLNVVQTIANKHLPEIDLAEQSELKSALLEAFFEGKKFSDKDC